MKHKDKMEIYYKLIVSKSQRALFRQTGSLGTAIPKIQKNQDTELQNVYQIKSFVVQSHRKIWERYRMKWKRKKYLLDLTRMQILELIWKKKDVYW